MPRDFYCGNCGLAFAVGSYLVLFDDHPARHLLVCRTCGGLHEYQDPLNVQGEARLLDWGGPVVLARRPEFAFRLHNDFPVPHVAPCPRGPQGDPDLTTIECARCRITSLTDWWDTSDRRCPRCDTAALDVSGQWEP